MWKITRNFVFPRWHAKKQNPAENISKCVSHPKGTVVCAPFCKTHYSGNNNKKKEQGYKDSKRYWNCEQFQFLLSRSFFMETAGWLGAVTALCFNLHFKHFNSFYKHEMGHSHCLFSRNVLAMPKKSTETSPTVNEPIQVQAPQVPTDTKETKVATEESDSLSTAMELKAGTQRYAAAVNNSTGVFYLNNNNKKAYQCFQAAARLGSSQGLYNLALCYEQGKGTKVNLNRAAFCYRKAAMKGHGAASFNLAVYFMKGIGGLPVDPQTARQLLAQAADKGIVEAQKYIGLEFLEENKFSEAYEIFEALDKNNDLDGKYYVGLCFENGWGVDKNEKKAVEMFSQAATLGHTESTLKLSKFYEDGTGGCKQDIDFALALCQIVADQGHEEGSLTLERLRHKQESAKKTLTSSMSSLKREKSHLHNSSSAPQIHDKPSVAKTCVQSFTSSYLNVITPFFSLEQPPLISNKSSFYIGDDEIASSILPCIRSTQLRLLTATPT